MAQTSFHLRNAKKGRKRRQARILVCGSQNKFYGVKIRKKIKQSKKLRRAGEDCRRNCECIGSRSCGYFLYHTLFEAMKIGKKKFFSS